MQSPALGLLHELGHLYRTLMLGDRTEEFMKSIHDPKDLIFIRDGAEKAIVDHYETPAAIKLKEGVCTSYAIPVTYYPTVSPNSTQEKKERSGH